MDHRSVTPMVEGGLLATGCVILGLLAVYMPVLGMAALLLWPVPIAVLTVRQGVGKGIMAAVVSWVLMALLIEPLISLRLFLSYAPVGVVMGFCIRRGWNGARVFLASFGVSFIAKAFVVGLMLLVMGINVMEVQLTALQESFNQSFALYESVGVPKADIDAARANVEPALELVSLLMPLILMLMAALDTVACYFMTGRILRRIGQQAPELPPFSEWRLPNFFLYLLGFALVGMYWGGTRGIEPLYQAALNANLAAMCAGTIQGISLLWYAANRFHVSGFFRGLILFIVLLNMVLLQIVAFTGLFDMVFDYRKRFQNKQQE